MKPQLESDVCTDLHMKEDLKIKELIKTIIKTVKLGNDNTYVCELCTFFDISPSCLLFNPKSGISSAL